MDSGSTQLILHCLIILFFSQPILAEPTCSNPAGFSNSSSMTSQTVQMEAVKNACTNACDSKSGKDLKDLGVFHISIGISNLFSGKPKEISEIHNQVAVLINQKDCPDTCIESKTTNTNMSTRPENPDPQSKCPKSQVLHQRSPDFSGKTCAEAEAAGDAWSEDVVTGKNSAGKEIAHQAHSDCSIYWDSISKTKPTASGCIAYVEVSAQPGPERSNLKFVAEVKAESEWTCSEKAP